MRISLIVYLIHCFLVPASANNKVLEIGILWNEEPTEVILSAAHGTYEVFGNGRKILDLTTSNWIQVHNENGQLHVATAQQDLGTHARVEVVRKTWGSSFRIKAVGTEIPTREYKDNLEIRPFGEKLRLVNNAYIEHYVAGVIEAEAGSKEPKEYYKVQAVICRTYALNNKRRHEAEGFHLCDKVHCQVYRGRPKSNPDIEKATRETIGIVVVDPDINLITAAFSSNCGGFTCNSEDVWSGKLSYLREREDENCLEEPHSYWRISTSREKWLGYLSSKYNYPVDDPAMRRKALEYCPDEREHFLSTNPPVPFKNVRMDWKLSSAFFSIDHVGEEVILEGWGYGHGVGLCQEGAMNMAKRGYDYTQILHYYYTDVHLVNLSVIDFFRSE